MNFNPKEMVMEMLKSNMNPFFSNLVDLAQKGNEKEVRNIVSNLYKQSGRDFEAEYQQLIKNPLGFINRR